MSFRGLQKPREMWAALHDQGQTDQRLWDMALQQLHGHGCGACRRHSKSSESIYLLVSDSALVPVV